MEDLFLASDHFKFIWEKTGLEKQFNVETLNIKKKTTLDVE